MGLPGPRLSEQELARGLEQPSRRDLAWRLFDRSRLAVILLALFWALCCALAAHLADDQSLRWAALGLVAFACLVRFDDPRVEL